MKVKDAERAIRETAVQSPGESAVATKESGHMINGSVLLQSHTTPKVLKYLPGDAIFDVVEETFRHQGVLIQIYQVGSL